MQGRQIVIGDIHGCPKTLERLLNEVIKVEVGDTLYYLGDYIDRGPNSKKVVDIIIEQMITGINTICLLGNHEDMLLKAIGSNEEYQNWIKNGGRQALNSFKINHPSQLKKRYLLFFQSLKPYVELDKFILVHGGLNFDIEDPLSDISSMCWIRNSEVDLKKTRGKRLVVGHTPSKLGKIKRSLGQNRILLDGGCVFGELENSFGNLVALELNTMHLFIQKKID